MKHIVFLNLILLIIVVPIDASARDWKAKKDSTAAVIQFVFCSDVHFGLTKATFRRKENATSADVNAAMIAQMNLLPNIFLPIDSGVAAGKKIRNIDAIVITGDICNRMENGVQSAAKSWKQFESDYIGKLNLFDKNHHKSQLLVTTGNHDISNAVGFEKLMKPLVDKSSLVGIYNLMMKPAIPKTNQSYNRNTDKIHYSRDIGNIHFVFVDGWPDSSERVWMENDLQNVPATRPVLLFAHAMPDVEPRFFQNPNGDHSINAVDRFENLVTETFKDGTSLQDSSLIERRGLTDFLQAHPNIKAYFHGHINYTEYYDCKGPDRNINLPCFRVDSPMKGQFSAKDETKLSFQLVSIDQSAKLMTVRECLWNTHPSDKTQKIKWGQSRTVSLN